MQTLFLSILAVLIIFSQYMTWRFQGVLGAAGRSIPVLYWVTDSHPARKEQAALFRAWLKERGLPDAEVRIDVNNQGVQKLLLQGVTGIGADLFDMHTGISYLADVGILEPVAPLLHANGISPDAVWAPLTAELTHRGVRYGTPKNGGFDLLLVNQDLFKRLGMPLPPSRWDLDTFERIGVEFDRRANAGLPRRQVFFADSMRWQVLLWTAGIPFYNETMSAAALNRKEAAEIFRRIQRWMYELHLLPSEADRQSIAVEQGWGGSFFQLFNKGYVGLLWTGRYALIQMRAMGKNPVMGAVEPPHSGYPVVPAAAVGVGVYRGSRHKDIAGQFQAFLHSEAYNLRIIKDVDGFPPVARYYDHPEFLTPTSWTNEWSLHAAFRKAADTLVCPREHSTFISTHVLNRIIAREFGAFMSRIATAEESLARMEALINQEIEQQVAKRADLRPLFNEAVSRQKKIDALKAQAKPIPLSLVDNPFLKRYYRDSGRGVLPPTP